MMLSGFYAPDSNRNMGNIKNMFGMYQPTHVVTLLYYSLFFSISNNCNYILVAMAYMKYAAVQRPGIMKNFAPRKP